MKIDEGDLVAWSPFGNPWTNLESAGVCSGVFQRKKQLYMELVCTDGNSSINFPAKKKQMNDSSLNFLAEHTMSFNLFIHFFNNFKPFNPAIVELLLI